ncbi:hypothetical protein CHL76_02195 [Marinococcus halophilus]|uniref:Uncharacterized protein n=1 Tax=Marinococcus halophilus TaxID=1371 RepID=A0A510Y1E3_MARHA|nr:hypothetical protein [Marinococcus halophilus]OZT81187.1 hypothetical protein CHL76_02195 [Marinococcus halophilus]GEK57120.1 hypothetical protein MHA01_00250 [Marinococcus halophilus]
MIPFTHDVTLLREGKPDAWGESTDVETEDLKGNIRSSTQVVKSLEGKEVVSVFNILFEGTVNIKHTDKIRFTEPNGEVREHEPITVKYLRNLSGEVAYTKVNV